MDYSNLVAFMVLWGSLDRYMAWIVLIWSWVGLVIKARFYVCSQSLYPMFTRFFGYVVGSVVVPDDANHTWHARSPIVYLGPNGELIFFMASYWLSIVAIEWT